MDSVKKVNFQDSSGAAIKEDGSLWIWGDIKRIGNGSIEKKEMSVPQKIMENVKDVKISRDTCLAIKEDGSLWMWGHNDNGELGIGWDYDEIHKPQKVLTNVKSVTIGAVCIAIKKDESLWMWGHTEPGLRWIDDETDDYYDENVNKSIPLQIIFDN